ncbi:MAG: DTW domain-containing protein [Candidatus Kuenenia sp.]|nr:DTW domain-containing protein [Candidatus Kuenenia hertensis]
MIKAITERCSQCRLIVQDCICPELTPVWTEHKITLLTSRRESRIPSNTGRLIQLMLENTSTIFIGEKGWEKEVMMEITRNDYTPVILFPMFSPIDSEDIIANRGKPLNIFVLDTSWRNARRWLHKPLLLNLRKIGLKKIPPSEYRLRKQSDKNNLCTFQAAISVLNELEIKDFTSASFQMYEKFRLWVQSLAKERGLIPRNPFIHTDINNCA